MRFLGSLAVEDHLRSILGIIYGLGIICGWGSFAVLYSTVQIRWFSQKPPWMSWDQSCLSPSWDSTAVKKNGRTFHVTTAVNSAGEAVVQYFSGQTDIQPPSCGAFVRTENDNSRLAGVCQKWGPKNGSYKAGKWGDGFDQARSYDHPAWVYGSYHWTLDHRSYGQAKRWECDDYLVGVTTGDFWKIYVR